jgi:outer membrane lipoprotein SlyB
VSFHRLVVSSAFAGCLACTVALAQARDAAPTATSPAVEGVDVEQVATLASGVPLRFTVFGTPRSLGALRIEGARRPLELRETEPGIYEGTYVIDAGDAIRADSRVTASLQRGGSVAYSTLDEPLLLETGSVPWSTAATSPATANGALAMSAPAPNGKAASPVPTSAATTLAASSGAPARVGVPVPLAAAALPPAAAPRGAEPCADCAVVESVQAVEAPPRGGTIGAIGGAIAGAILGKEAGAAHNRRMLSLLGAIGGAFAGREVERKATQSTHYDVVLRLPDGSALKRRYEEAPPFSTGETIRLGASARQGAPVPAPL